MYKVRHKTGIFQQARVLSGGIQFGLSSFENLVQILYIEGYIGTKKKKTPLTFRYSRAQLR